MGIAPIDIKNEGTGYLDEKELFILYSLLRNRHISTWGNAFTPNKTSAIFAPKHPADIAEFEEEVNKAIEEVTRQRRQSSATLAYLIDLGRELDGEAFSIHCDADYALVEGGFLCDYVGEVVWEYLADTEENRSGSEKYKSFSKEQRDFIKYALENEDNDSVQLMQRAHPPIPEYREAILEKNADVDFIDLVNKLVKDWDGGRWDTSDVVKFLEIYRRHSKKEFQENALTKKTIFHQDTQTKLANVIFEHVNFRLKIKNTKKLGAYLSHYLCQFANDELNGRAGYGLTASIFSEGLTIPLHTKLFGFRKQKDILLRHIEAKHEEYQRDDLEIGHPHFEPEYIGDRKGNEVEITLRKVNKEEDLFLFVHTMLAMEMQKQIEVEDFSYGTTGIFDLYDRGFLFKIKLSSDNNKETGVHAFFEGFDEKYHLLKIAGKEVELAKKGRETDAVLLMRTLLKAQGDGWRHNDEILEDWGMNDADIKKVPRNKIYFAGKKINTAVALKTGISDLIEYNTFKARINPKYRKVDE